MDRQNLTLLTDLYELTMMQGYFKNKEENRTVIFDAFYRTNPFGGGYAIMCGVEQLVRYVKDLHFSSQDTRTSWIIWQISSLQVTSMRFPKEL